MKRKPKHLRTDTQHQWIARLSLLGWSAQRIARKLHCSTRTITRAMSTPEYQAIFTALQRDHLGRVDRHLSALLLGAVEALERMLKNPDWRARDSAIAHILRVHGKYIEKFDVSGSLTHGGTIQHDHDHQGRFTSEGGLFTGLPEGPLTDALRIKTRELLAEFRKIREPRALPARLIPERLTDTNGHSDEEDSA